MRRISKRTGISCVLILSVLLSVWGVKKKQRNERRVFNLSKIASDLFSCPQLDMEFKTMDYPEQLAQFFSQKYAFLGQGSECFCFQSADGQYVLKIFKKRYFQPFWLVESFPLLLLKTTILKRYHDKFESRRLRTFTAYKMAYERFPKETGVLYIHLNKTDHLKRKIEIKDKFENRYSVDLDKTYFVVQKKAVPAYQYFKEHVRCSDLKRAQSGIRNLFEMILQMEKAGFIDSDARIGTNYGFIESVPILIDVGHYVQYLGETDREQINRKIFRIRQKMEVWAQRKCPELLEYIISETERIELAKL